MLNEMTRGLDPSTLLAVPSTLLVEAARRELLRFMFGGDVGESAAGVIWVAPDMALFSLSLRWALKSAPDWMGCAGVVALMLP